MDTLLALAVLPVAALLYYIYRADPEEKEPPRLLATLLGFGVLSTFPAIIFESLGSDLFLDDWIGSKLSYLVFENFLVVALVEEGCKYFFLRWRTWNDPAFDYVFDGIVYAVFVSLGFAVAENINYVFTYGFGTGVMRAFTAIPGHAIFAVFMGYYYGEAKRAQVQGRHGLRLLNTVLALVIPILCHGAYDFLASADGVLALLAFYALLAGMVYVGFQLVKRESAEAKRLR